MFFDSHSHIGCFPVLSNNISEVISLAKKKGLAGIIDSGIDYGTSVKALRLSKKYPDFIYPTAGVQPEVLIPGSDIYQKDFDIDKEFERIEKLIKSNFNDIKAVGECGLDFYWLRRRSPHANRLSLDSRKKQKKLFKKHIELAEELDLPLVIHSRGAEEVALNILNAGLLRDLSSKRIAISDLSSPVKPALRQTSKRTALFHSFTGPQEVAKKILSSGYYISFNGIITYPKADTVREIFKFAWEHYPDQILSETDAPLLAPQTKRGETGYPSDVVEVVEKMAEVGGVTLNEMAEKIFENSVAFWG